MRKYKYSPYNPSTKPNAKFTVKWKGLFVSSPSKHHELQVHFTIKKCEQFSI